RVSSILSGESRAGSLEQRSIAVVERCENHPVPRSYCLNFSDPLLSDIPSSGREGHEASLQSKSHAFEQTSMDHIRERMPIQNSLKVAAEAQPAGDLSQTSIEDSGAGHIRARRQVLRVPGVTNDR